MVTFLGLKNHTYPYDAFFGTLFIWLNSIDADIGDPDQVP